MIEKKQRYTEQIKSTIDSMSNILFEYGYNDFEEWCEFKDKIQLDGRFSLKELKVLVNCMETITLMEQTGL